MEGWVVHRGIKHACPVQSMHVSNLECHKILASYSQFMEHVNHVHTAVHPRWREQGNTHNSPLERNSKRSEWVAAQTLSRLLPVCDRMLYFEP